MSGFGSGFGSGPPTLPSFIGTPAPGNPPQQQQQFGGGGFVTAQPSGGGFGGSGFGASPSPSTFGASNSFGQPQPQLTTNTSFGGTNTFSPGNTGGLGNTGGFGTASAQPFGTSTGGFNTSPASSSGFGSSTPFGASVPQTSFGQQPTSSFGGISGGSSFGNFGSTQPQQTIASPFGTTSSTTQNASSTISFGVSSNIAPTAPIGQQQGFGTSLSTPFSSSAPSGFGTSTPSPAFGTSTSTQAPPFGSSSASNSFAPSGFGGRMQSDYNDDMMDGEGDSGFESSPQSNPFGAAPATTFSSSPWTSNQSFSSSSNGGRVASPEPLSSGIQDSSMSPLPANSKEDELAQLKAKKAEILRKKKKKLEELKRRKEAADAASMLNASAPSFVPKDSTARDGDTNSLADRNAARFAKPDTDDSLLPEELRNREVVSGYKDGADETQDYDNAVSLVGTCPYMCPDDELIRRQKEGDIQLLETPQPGTIHPTTWTLRNTAVKRFRRSAADYKLDVPAWVRPPDVLEVVCGYLEEWVMERDRQGPDPRFQQMDHPPSLDVYQFIWDRTRMVRKDFILQNYVGTGGKCDARAVRCHERIARWHAMCEHQLSHIPEFVNAQSQQNVQEFGQAMKTLNMYYDDSLARSTIEVPDDDGNETLTDLTGTTQGCTSQLVEGVNPVDFDGTPLKNDPTSIHTERRLIGPQAVNSPAHGTAEPEMRGLYILTTMNNDGGMEVLKFSAYLHSKRPEVYNSKPVQLAMRIFKAKKEHNYARFFSILRDPQTPYLFACIMFKHVEQMRKYAFRIMSRTYGGIARKTKQALEDQYPLRRLVRLLCFEDEEEAIAACRHYNITVEEVQVTNPDSSSPASQTIVYWKRSSFREPKDPEKDFVLSLKPRKMVRTIESKLNGATRLAVCRGEVSGEGAALSRLPESPLSDRSTRQVSAPTSGMVTPPVGLSADEVAVQEQHTEEQAAKRRMEERRRLREERKKQEQKQREREEQERKQKEEADRQALILKKQQEEERNRKMAEEREALKRKQIEEERRRKLELEEAKRAAEAAAREEQQRQEAERKRLIAEAAARKERLRQEAEERLRREELRKKREEEEGLERIRREQEEKKRLEEEKRRYEEEMRRQEQLRLQREREEQERRRREEEARRIAAEKEAEMNQARKFLIWRRLRSKLDRELRMERTKCSLSRLDPTCLGDIEQVMVDTSSVTSNVGYAVVDAYSELLPGVHVLDRLSRQSSPAIDLSTMLRKSYGSIERSSSSRADTVEVVLAKVAVVLPTFVGPKADAMRWLVHSWIGQRLQYGVVSKQPADERRSSEIRIVALNGDGGTVGCDLALLVIPPFSGDEVSDVYSSVSFPQFNDVVPRVILCLDNGSNQAYAAVVNNLLSSIPQDIPFFQVGEEFRTDLCNLALEDSCDALVQSFAIASSQGHTRGTVVRLSMAQLASRCIRSSLWRDGIKPGTNEENLIMDRARDVLVALLAELKSLSAICRRGHWSSWPAREFVNVDGVVPNYFGLGLHLPNTWKESLSRHVVEPAIMELYKQLDGVSYRQLIFRMAIDAPERVKQDCRDMIERRQFRRCLEYVLMWGDSSHKPSATEAVVYMPRRSVCDVVEGCVRKLGLEDENDHSIETSEPDQIEYAQEPNENMYAVELMQAMRSPEVLLEEYAFRQQDEAVDIGLDSDVPTVPLAETSTTPNSNIMSPPVGVQTPETPSVGVQTPANTPADLLLRGTKRLLDSDDATTGSKRRRDSPLTRNQKESIAFTKKLEALLHGETVSEIKIGSKRLSDLLRDAPDIQLPQR